MSETSIYEYQKLKDYLEENPQDKLKVSKILKEIAATYKVHPKVSLTTYIDSTPIVSGDGHKANRHIEETLAYGLLAEFSVF